MLCAVTLALVGIFPTRGFEVWTSTAITDVIDLERCVLIHRVAAIVHVVAMVVTQFNVYWTGEPFSWCRDWPFLIRNEKPWSGSGVRTSEKITEQDIQRAMAARFGLSMIQKKHTQRP